MANHVTPSQFYSFVAKALTLYGDSTSLWIWLFSLSLNLVGVDSMFLDLRYSNSARRAVEAILSGASGTRMRSNLDLRGTCPCRNDTPRLVEPSLHPGVRISIRSSRRIPTSVEVSGEAGCLRLAPTLVKRPTYCCLLGGFSLSQRFAQLPYKFRAEGRV